MKRGGQDALYFFLNLSRHSGDLAHFRVGSRPACLVNHPAHAEHVLAVNQASYVNRPHPYARLLPILTPAGRFFLRLGGQEGDPRRHLERIERLSLAAVDEIVRKTPAGRRPDRDLLATLKVTMLRLAVRILFDVEAGSLAGDFVRAVNRFERAHFRHGDPSPARDPWAASAQRRLAGRILAVRGRRPDNRRWLAAVIQTLTNAYGGSATALCWTLYLVARDRPLQERLRREIDGVLADRPPTFRHVAQLTGLRDVLSESMRLYPPAWMLGREALADDPLGGDVIPKGALVFVSPYTMHRHPALWHEPERFEPKRFRRQPSRDRHRFAYFPFGGGTRKCPAYLASQQLILMLAALLRRYRLDARSAGPVVPRALIALRPYPAIGLRCTRRPGRS